MNPMPENQSIEPLEPMSNNPSGKSRINAFTLLYQLLINVVLLLTFSGLCGISNSLGEMIFFRVGQGFTGLKQFFLSMLVLPLVGALPCHAQKAMMFNNVGQSIEHSQGVWIVEVVKPVEDKGLDHTFEANILQLATPLRGFFGFSYILPSIEPFRPLVGPGRGILPWFMGLI